LPGRGATLGDVHDLSRRPLALVAMAAATLAAGLGAVSAQAAPVFTTVGQVAPGNANGGCLPCTAVQRTTDPAGAYTFPYTGVLTRFSVRTGSVIATAGGEWLKARTFRPGDATHARVISESAQGAITTPSTVQTYWDRVPAASGDVLGAQFHTGAFIDETPYLFTTGTAAGDTAATTFGDPGPAVGDDAVATAFANQRVNVSARLEHDDDHDGYGDGSQDLCLSDAAHATSACSGTLTGSDLQGPYKQVGFACGYACARVQLTSGGVSTSPAADGVVVRWRLQAPKDGSYHLAILEPAGDGSYTFARVSDAVTIGADEALWTFPARLPIKAGGYVAFVPPPFASQTTFLTTPAGATYTNVNDAPVGSSTTLAAGVAGAFLYDADIEPDADHDGYGDVTQDACATDAATHDACPPPVTPPDGGTPGTGTPPSGTPGSGTPASGTPGAATPAQAAALTAFRARYRRFRVNRIGPVARTSASRRTHAGTTLVVALSRGATVRFTVKRLTGGVRTGTTCRVRRAKARGRRCTIATTIHRFAATLAAGSGAVTYAGRYRRSGRTRMLTAGRYRIEAAVLSGSRLTGKVRSVTVSVVR